MSKSPALVTIVILLIACRPPFSGASGKSQRPPATPEPDTAFKKLREQIFAISPAEVGITRSRENPNVWGVLMEAGSPKSVITLVSLADGTTSIYFSSGGGIIGGGGHEAVAKTTKALVKEAEKYYAGLPQTKSFSLPATGRIKFFFLTYSGVHVAEADERALLENRDRFSPFFLKCNGVVTELRKAQERKK